MSDRFRTVAAFVVYPAERPLNSKVIGLTFGLGAGVLLVIVRSAGLAEGLAMILLGSLLGFAVGATEGSAWTPGGFDPNRQD